MMKKKKLHLYWKNLISRRGHLIKKSMKWQRNHWLKGKSCGEDGIPSEVLKRCDMDAIILSFCNNALVKS